MERGSWRSFRSAFQALDSETRKLVVEYRATNNATITKKDRHVSLIHKLVHCVKAKPPVPLDLLEAAMDASPSLLTALPVPLWLAIQRKASPAVQ